MTNGDSAGNLLRRTTLGGAVLPWQDALNEGPLPPLPPAGFRQARARFLGECGWGSPRQILAELGHRDRLLGQAVTDGRQVVLWFEHDLYDQLQLLQILTLVGDAGHDPANVELVNVGAFDGRPDFHGLGELTAAELESLWDVRRPVTRELVELGRLAWDAVRAPRPTEIEALLSHDTSALPFLAAALRRLLEQLPDTEGGLSRSERQPLDSLAAGPRTVVELFEECQRLEEAPFDGDAWFFKRLAELAAGERPLVALAGGGAIDPPPLGDPRSFARARIALTEGGRAVLAGNADRVALLGIDRWVGGTHLRPGNLWRWDRPTGRVVAEPGVA